MKSVPLKNIPLKNIPSIIVVISFLIGSLMVVPAPVFAAEEEEPVVKKVERRKQTPALSQRIYKKLSEIQGIIEGDPEKPDAKIPKEKIEEAFKKATEMEQSTKLSSYERAQIQNIKAFLYYLKDDYDGALKYYLLIANNPDTPEGLYLASLRTATQLYMVKEQYKKAITSARQVLAQVGQDADMLALIATAYYQTGNNNQAFKYIKQAVDQYLAKSRVPKEQWLVLLRYMYIEKKQNKNATKILKILVKNYPRASYLLQLASVYGLEGKESKQLAVMELLFEGNYLKNEGEYRNLTGLMLNLGISYKAARILETLFKDERVEETEQNLLLLSQAYYQSHQVKKSIPPLLKAAKKSKKGDLYLRLAYSYSGLEDWKNTSLYATKAIDRGGLKDKERAIILLGTALFNNEQYESAIKQFYSIKDSKKNDKIARDWITYISNTIERQQIIAKIQEESNTVESLDALKQLNKVIN